MSTVLQDLSFDAAPMRRSAVKRRRRILCVSDLGSDSENALQRASRLARESGGELLVVHVLSNKRSEEVVLSSADRARLRVCVSSERTIPDHEQPTAVQIRRGESRKVIRNTALEWQADLIVIAWERPRSLDWMLGSIGQRLLALVNVPVLIVRNTPAHAPIANYSKVMVATDLTPRSLRIARKACELGFMDDVEVTFVHAFGPPYEGINLGDPRAAEQLETYADKTSRLVELKISEQVGTGSLANHRIRVRTRLAATAHEGVASTIEDLGGDLLVMGASRRGPLSQLLKRSTGRQILEGARCDVLLVEGGSIA